MLLLSSYRQYSFSRVKNEIERIKKEIFKVKEDILILETEIEYLESPDKIKFRLLNSNKYRIIDSYDLIYEKNLNNSKNT